MIFQDHFFSPPAKHKHATERGLGVGSAVGYASGGGYVGGGGGYGGCEGYGAGGLDSVPGGGGAVKLPPLTPRGADRGGVPLVLELPNTGCSRAVHRGPAHSRSSDGPSPTAGCQRAPLSARFSSEAGSRISGVLLREEVPKSARAPPSHHKSPKSARGDDVLRPHRPLGLPESEGEVSPLSVGSPANGRILEALPLLLREDDRVAALASAHQAELACWRRKRWDETAAKGRRRAQRRRRQVCDDSADGLETEDPALHSTPAVSALTPDPASPKVRSEASSAAPSPKSLKGGHVWSDSSDDGLSASEPSSPTPSNLAKQGAGIVKTPVLRKKSVQCRLRRLNRLRTRHVHWLQDQAMAQGASMNANQKERIQETFFRYDGDCSGSLDSSELREALADLGYSPRSQQEKKQFADILARTNQDGDGDLTLSQFETLVSGLMQLFREMLSLEVEEQFGLHDADGSGTLSISEVNNILDEMNLGPRTAEEHKMVHDAMNKAAASPSREEGAELDGEAQRGELELTFFQFEGFLAFTRENLGRHRRARLHDIVANQRLDRDTVQILNDELCEFKDRFDALDKKGTGYLDQQDIKVLLADHGMRPTAKAQRQEMQFRIKFLNSDGDGHCSFADLLGLILGSRELAKAARSVVLRELYSSMDKEGNNSLTLGECSRILGQMGLNPRTRAQQRQIAILFETADEDGSGDFSYDEFAVLNQLVHELLQRVHRKQEREAALQLGITPRQIEEYLEAFDMFDEEEVGELRVEDVRRLMDSLRIPISGTLLNELVREVDVDHSGVIEFNEFLMLMSLVEQRKAKGTLLVSRRKLLD
eukprot:CAMPEP_0115357676 /NCGR_PEP_ID=MMETSP0270-20121206/100270_1 /TAXON_ID=71861 /ORGANISM="Scrippsiella trochoidea, Strain CCMP3099" /LENGTH=823 /DNA_ID=CAMNT_0002780139 /DNA_START=147 /DNA_END=2618 /DNA_ORIENTATION=-